MRFHTFSCAPVAADEFPMWTLPAKGLLQPGIAAIPTWNWKGIAMKILRDLHFVKNSSENLITSLIPWLLIFSNSQILVRHQIDIDKKIFGNHNIFFHLKTKTSLQVLKIFIKAGKCIYLLEIKLKAKNKYLSIQGENLCPLVPFLSGPYISRSHCCDTNPSHICGRARTSAASDIAARRRRLINWDFWVVFFCSGRGARVAADLH